MESFRALVLEKAGDGIRCGFRTIEPAALPPGEVLIEVTHSSLNYKDGLAVTGKGKIARSYPMVPGIDLAGVVRESESPAFAAGDPVLATGWGLGEIQFGGYAELARVPAEKLTPLPNGLDAPRAMALGTAGFTAVLAVQTLEEHGLRPGTGPILVTGATGGVGSLATHLLSKQGHEIVAVTGRTELTPFLEKLGASRILPRQELARTSKPLESEQWAGAVDTVGGEMLTTMLAQMKRAAGVACCGNARGPELHTTVFPFILRGVALLGIDSNWCPTERRVLLWQRLAADVDLDLLDSLTRTVPFSDIPEAAAQIVDGKLHGRTVIAVRDDTPHTAARKS
ncbi:MAG: MDR family oxidoreductase [Candidatus Eisenbacteria bacterium]